MEKGTQYTDKICKWTFLSRRAGEHIRSMPERRDAPVFFVILYDKSDVEKPRRINEEIRVVLTATIGSFKNNRGMKDKILVVKNPSE